VEAYRGETSDPMAQPPRRRAPDSRILTTVSQKLPGGCHNLPVLSLPAHLDKLLPQKIVLLERCLD
jgi:hypothetical protein